MQDHSKTLHWRWFLLKLLFGKGAIFNSHVKKNPTTAGKLEKIYMYTHICFEKLFLPRGMSWGPWAILAKTWKTSNCAGKIWNIQLSHYIPTLALYVQRTLLPPANEVEGRYYFHRRVSFCPRGSAFPQCHGAGRPSPSRPAPSPLPGMHPHLILRDTVNKWAVRILLEYILVC